jgi:hypothetical protein
MSGAGYLSEVNFRSDHRGIGVLVTSLLSGRDGLYGFRFASGTYRCDTVANVA